MTLLDDLSFLQFLKENGYLHVRPTTPGRWAAVMPLMYTHAIITGRMGDEIGYDDRWCFSSMEKAKAALDVWDGTGEPQGWHRHPDSGRRREHGDASLEIVAP